MRCHEVLDSGRAGKNNTTASVRVAALIGYAYCRRAPEEGADSSLWLQCNCNGRVRDWHTGVCREYHVLNIFFVVSADTDLGVLAKATNEDEF